MRRSHGREESSGLGSTGGGAGVGIGESMQVGRNLASQVVDGLGSRHGEEGSCVSRGKEMG